MVFITGSSSGIGESTAYGFAKLSCRLIVHGTDEDRLNQVAERCRKLCPKGYEVSCVLIQMYVSDICV